MRTFTAKELKKVLEKHEKWVNGAEGGERADFRSANLRGAYLGDADLRGANFIDANLSDACFIGANLINADLRDADLIDADLRCANLRGADLSGADLRGADLSGIIVSSITNGYWLVCPEIGEFHAFKKAQNELIIELLIPADARRSSATTRKCRCDKAVVLSITNLDGTPAGVDEVPSSYDRNFIYKIGETVTVKDYNPDRWEECSAGIHFFITREEAVMYP